MISSSPYKSFSSGIVFLFVSKYMGFWGALFQWFILSFIMWQSEHVVSIIPSLWNLVRLALTYSSDQISQWPMCTWKLYVSIYWVQSTTWLYYIKSSIILSFKSFIILAVFECMIYSFLRKWPILIVDLSTSFNTVNYIFWVCLVSCVHRHHSYIVLMDNSFLD